jgi:hypothetical protein
MKANIKCSLIILNDKLSAPPVLAVVVALLDVPVVAAVAPDGCDVVTGPALPVGYGGELVGQPPVFASDVW